MSHNEIKDKLLALYQKTLDENKVLLGKVKTLEQKVVTELNKNVLLQENIRTLKNILKKVEEINKK